MSDPIRSSAAVPSFLRLAGRRGAWADALQGLLVAQPEDNKFNPSFVEHGEKWFVAYRHYGAEQRKPMQASLLIAHRDGRVSRRVNLSEHVRGFGQTVLSDPKLLVLHGDVWLTYNDGWSATRNRLFLLRVTPTLGEPIECDFEGRRQVEKNWGFVGGPDGLTAIYSIDPLRLLDAPYPVSGQTRVLFSERGASGPSRREPLGLTIGTQPFECAGRLYLVAHEKWSVGRYRMYWGRGVRLTPTSEGGYDLEVSPRRLFHATRALVGSMPRHNRNLLSCTYFSGLAIEGADAVLAYGINDVRAGFAQLPASRIWSPFP